MADGTSGEDSGWWARRLSQKEIIEGLQSDPKTRGTLPPDVEEDIEPFDLSGPTTVSTAELDAALDRQEREGILRLRKPYAVALLVFLAVQLVFMNVILILTGIHALDIPASTMQFYLTATLGEIFGLVTVATRFLFSDKPFLAKH